MSKGASQIVTVVSLVVIVVFLVLYVHTNNDIVDLKNIVNNMADSYSRKLTDSTDTLNQYYQVLMNKTAVVQSAVAGVNAPALKEILRTNKVPIPTTPLPLVAKNDRTQVKLPRILCWVLTDPSQLDKRAIHVKETWARHCDLCLFMSSQTNDTFPTIGLPVDGGRSHLATKSKAAWTYVHDHHLNDFDYFAKADDDTFLVIENLKQYLAKRNPEEPEFFGHRMYLTPEGKKITYNSGGPGQILSRKSLQLLVEKSYAQKDYDCMKDGQGEDWKTAWCLTRAGAHTVDTRDAQGRMTFMIFHIGSHMQGGDPDWYTKRIVDEVGKSFKCCSEYPLGFHYVSGLDMRKLYYYMYEMKHDGPVVTSLSDDEKFTFFKPDGHEQETFKGPII